MAVNARMVLRQLSSKKHLRFLNIVRMVQYENCCYPQGLNQTPMYSVPVLGNENKRIRLIEEEKIALALDEGLSRSREVRGVDCPHAIAAHE